MDSRERRLKKGERISVAEKKVLAREKRVYERELAASEKRKLVELWTEPLLVYH